MIHGWSWIAGNGTGVLFTQTSSKTVASSAAETTLLDGGVGSLTLPAQFFQVGKTIDFEMWGFHSSTANPTITARIKIGGTTVMTMSGTSGNGTNDTFRIRGQLTCRTIGVTGTVFCQGYYDEVHSTGLKIGSDNTVANTINTTIENVVDITIQWSASSPSNTITATNFVMLGY